MSVPARALVTGGSGFIGSHLVRHLLDAGSQVTIVARSDSAKTSLDSRADVIVDDGSVETLTAAVAAAGPEVCFHLATHFSASHTGDEIAALIESNIAFGTRVLEACKGVEGLSFVNVGTIWQHYDARQYSPVSLYGATKQAFVDLARYYAEVEGLKLVTVELSDTYGPDDKRRKLVQLLMETAIAGDQLQMSPGDQLIFLLHVSDVVEALLHAAGLASSEAPTYAVPPLQPKSLKELVALTSEVIGKPISIEFGARPYRPREMMQSWQYSPDLPGWRANVTLEEGLLELWNNLQQKDA